jgi:hypothetical protein
MPGLAYSRSSRTAFALVNASYFLGMLAFLPKEEGVHETGSFTCNHFRNASDANLRLHRHLE